jgi:RHS repeat-associated protein
MKCWGGNPSGQLGDGTLVNTNAPITSLFASSTTYTPDSTHKHAVASLSTGETYTYDANGNMITRVEGGLTYTQTFNAENQLISVTVSGQTTQFIYDGDGNLIKKINPDNSRTIYVGSVYEVDKSAGGSVTSTTTYYPAGGAMRVDGTLYYILKDNLGSASVTTDSSGNIVGEQRYYPFGETRLTTGSILTDKLYTSQRELTGLGIYHYGARFYSPKLGRFLSPDSIVPSYKNPQNLNRFAYVLNNPLRYNDPSGHSSVDVAPPVIFVVLSILAIAYVIYDRATNGVSNQDKRVQPPDPGGLDYSHRYEYRFTTQTAIPFPTPVTPSATNCPTVVAVNCGFTPTPTRVYGPELPPTGSPTSTPTNTPTSSPTNTSSPTSTLTTNTPTTTPSNRRDNPPTQTRPSHHISPTLPRPGRPNYLQMI